MEVQTNDTTADVQMVDTDKTEAVTDVAAIVDDAKLDDIQSSDAVVEASCEPIAEVATVTVAQLEEAPVIAVDENAPSIDMKIDENGGKVDIEIPVVESISAPAEKTETASMEVTEESAPAAALVEPEPVESVVEEALVVDAPNTVVEPQVETSANVIDAESDTSAIANVSSDLETDMTTDDNDEDDVTKNLYKDENLLQILSSSPDPDADIPSQNDKWNESAEISSDEDIEDEIEDEEDDYEEEEEAIKPQPPRRQLPKEDEILSLSDDDDEYIDHNVDKKAADANYPRSEYSDEDVGSILGEEDEYGSDHDSIDYSDEEQRSDDESSPHKERIRSPNKRSDDKPATATNDVKSVATGSVDNSSIERDANG